MTDSSNNVVTDTWFHNTKCLVNNSIPKQSAVCNNRFPKQCVVSDNWFPKQSIVCAIASDVLLQHKQTESLVEALGSYSEGQGHRVRILENIVYPTYQDCFIEPYFVTSSVIVNYYRVTCKQYGLMSTGLRS